MVVYELAGGSCCSRQNSNSHWWRSAARNRCLQVIGSWCTSCTCKLQKTSLKSFSIKKMSHTMIIMSVYGRMIHAWLSCYPEIPLGHQFGADTLKKRKFTVGRVTKVLLLCAAPWFAVVICHEELSLVDRLQTWLECSIYHLSMKTLGGKPRSPTNAPFCTNRVDQEEMRLW